MLNFFPKTHLIKYQQLFRILCLLTLTLIFGIQSALAEQTTATTENLIAENTSLSSQAALKFKHLLSADGLSQNNVFDITQGHDGFIWIATEDGLNRYDGKNFVHYRKNLADPNSIAHNFIRKVFVDNNGILWVATKVGLSKYNVKLDNFENYYHQENNTESLKDDLIWDIYQDKKENIWISTTNGIQKYDPASNNFKRIKIHSLEDEIKEIYTIFQDSNDNFWFGGYGNGIYLANKDLNYSSSLQKNNNKWHITIPANSLFDIKEINNNYWLATERGIYVLDQNYNLIDRYHLNHPSNKLISNTVRSITQFDEFTVWVGTDNGLNIINLQNNIITSYYSDTKAKSSPEDWINSVFKDQFGNLWVGTYGKGVNLFLKDSLNFSHYLSGTSTNSITSFAETTDGTIWFYSQESGLNYIDKIGKKIPKEILQNEDIYQLITDNNNNLWLTTLSNKLFVFSQNKNTITEITLWQKESLYDSNYTPNLLNNSIWFVDENGQLANYHLDTQKFNRFTIKDQNLNKIKSIHIDNNNTLWTFSSNNQLISLKITSSNIVENTIIYHDLLNIDNLSMIDVRSIKSYNHWVWLTSEQGIILYNKETKKTDYFNESNGLFNNSIDSIEIDEAENAWLSTNGAITVIYPNTKKISNFNEDLHLSDSQFIWNSSLKTANDKIYFGGNNGFHLLFPSKIINIKQEINSPVFIDLLIANKKINVQTFTQTRKPNKEFTLNSNINNLEVLTLRHEQSPFTIEFTSPNSRLPNQLSYRYRLKGLEKAWINAGKNKHFATYTNLSAGDYNFEVEAYDLLGTAKSEVNTLNIHILAPWWLSKSAIIVYTLLFFLVVGYVIQQMRHKRLYHLQIQKSEERLKLSLWGSGDEMWDWNIITGKIYRSNIWGILEFPQDGKRNVGSDKTNINEHDIARVRDAINDHFDNDTDHFEATYRVKNKDDKWIWVLDRGKIVERDEKGTPTRMTGTLKDISRIKKADERLKLFAKCIENISDAVVIYDRAFNIVDVNKSYQRITQKTRKEMLGITLEFAQYPKSFTKDVKKHLITKGSWHDEIESKRDNGEEYLTDLNIDVILDENKSISHFVGVFSDITKRKETEAELRKLANSDTLTGLPNRSYFQANQTLLVNKKAPHALLVFDLDNFKKINDSMGHEVGDVLLCQVAKRMQAVGRKQDTVYRLGGDEFSIIIENTNDIHTITSIAKDVLTTIAQPLKLRNQEVVLFSSLGIVLYPEDGISPQELLKNADTAMYHAKNNGGNKYQFFSDSMNKAAVKRLQVESLIRHGLKEDSFSVFYQPKIEISTGKVAGMEALVRFETPKKGIISPITFIPISEETGQIIDIGEVVLRKSCFATKKWVDAGLFSGRVAVNLSAVQFTQPNLVGMIADILKESQLPAKYLELEITEGTVMDSPQKAIDIMLQIRAMGIHLSLDDFGTGYSSLAYLKKFPLNTLKIDKAFVDDIEESEQGRNMVATIVTIAHNLGMQVVAEGVETNQQLSFLSGLRCEQLQGYLYSKPLPEGDFQKYLLSYQITKASTNFGKTSF
ncbi:MULTISPECIES: EAL domain-containing protein [unclassified Colwellia]|uniref:EAL domain-containing protein n=1 Tax=unclassified Colwellia TaxID=196834 RepID=UPI0015F575E9|nr:MULTISPECIES: EAL domain-containing protein [unclassified Colwellia]MBA6379571.1 EAL domain-containing protein [Colwellia sp. BRX10-7]MBA6386168.1 EAL domain-containing protein [Colwellia sp. BRX10-2]MBA6403110.1 EAL domain-containing protein [Colwellia sp. BRX10-5]MBA6405895.1 EAL domain-containing protein [Colwellia sp. BRX10-1]